jgi:hypothetical protein
MTEEQVKIEFRRHSPGIYIGRLWGIMYADRFEIAMKKRTDFIDQYDDDKYVMVYDLTEVIYLHSPTVEAGRSIVNKDPRSLGFILVGGPRLVRTIAILVNKISKRFHFEKSMASAIRLAEKILQQSSNEAV